MIESREPFSYKEDKSVPTFPDTAVFTVMDAQCGLCAKGATWIAQNDLKQEFTIIPLQSALGNALIAHYGMNPDDPASWLYVEDGRAFCSLNAFIRAGHRLGGKWKLLSLLDILPTSLQDRLYRFFAVNRLRFFGSADLCELPHSEVQKRLLR